MKPPLAPAVSSTLALLSTAGCATRTTASGGRNHPPRWCPVTRRHRVFQPAPATTVAVDTTKIVGQGTFRAKTTLLWGLITLQDY